jgi:hypothetical protein
MSYQCTLSEETCLKAANTIYYPINSIFDDETRENKTKNLQLWKQIQPEIQSIAQDVIYNIKVVQLAIRHIRMGKIQSLKYKKIFADAIFAIFSIGKNYCNDWIDLCDKELNYEYSNEVFQYQTDTRKHTWISFSMFLNSEKLQNYFNACLLMCVVELMTMNTINIEIMRTNYYHLSQFRSSIQEKFQIMNYYYSFQHRWKGSQYYNAILFS